MKTKNTIDFTKVDWENIGKKKLQFFFKEAVEYNDTLIDDINNLINKAFQLLTVAITAFSAAIGFFLAIWGNPDKEAIAYALLTACIGLGIILVLLLLAVFNRSIYRGKATPNIIFFDGPDWAPLYKAPLSKIMRDGIPSYNTFITRNNKVMEYRSRFLTAGMIGFFVVPVATIMVFLILS